MSSYSAGYPTELKKGMALASLIIGILSMLTFGCLGIGAITGLVLGILALMKANGTPAEYGGKGLAVGGIVTNALSLVVIIPVAIIAAIAIPSLLRARISANESGTIGDIRTVISAETIYQSANNGAYDTLECLASPQSCIPGYSGPVMLDRSLASAAVKSGYARTFHPGPRMASGGALKMSPSSLASFAYVAVPISPGKTGVRGFCGDASGRICYTLDGAAPEVVEGMCAPTCTTLR